MKYSYIKPRTKTAFTAEVKLLLTFFSITLFMLFSTYAFLLFKDYTFAKDLKHIQNLQAQLQINLSHMKEDITFIEKENVLAQSIQTKNLVLKDSITNLFDLVPERITLSQAKLQKNALILYGITPNKDVYNFMLQAPLRSIFHKTYSSFYPAGNGWLSFVSTNYTDEDLPMLEGESADEN
jgi:hypothetical protein